MKKKRIGKRVLAAVLAVTVCAVGFIGFLNREKVMALFGVDKELRIKDFFGDSEEGYEDAANFYASYTKATLDMVNGEFILTADNKANVMTNIYKKKQKLTILEIVPYELASVYNVMIPDDRQRELVHECAEEFFKQFGPPAKNDGTWNLAEDARLLAGGTWGDEYTGSYSKLYTQNNYTNNFIASSYQPIELHRDGEAESYEYSVYMPNYFMFKLMEGYEKYGIYDYFVNKENVEVKVVVPGQVTAGDLQKILLGADNGSMDPVDLIYVGGRAVSDSGPKGNINRNLFMSLEPKSEDDRAVMVQFAKDGANVDSLAERFGYHTGVYYIDDGGNYTEYKVSELVSKKVWYDSYSYVNGEYKPNDFEWDEVQVLMEYIFGNYNDNYVHVDSKSGAKTQQRVSCSMSVADLSSIIIGSTNIGKLYYLLCKTTDQASDIDGCTIRDTGYQSIHASGNQSTHTPYFDFCTYYGSPDYFLKKYFDNSGNASATYSNGISTVTYDGNVNWDIIVNDRQGIINGASETDFRHDKPYTDEIEKIKNNMMNPLTVKGDIASGEMFYIHEVYSGNYTVYNGMLGLGAGVGNLIDFGFSNADYNGGYRDGVSHQRLDLAIGEKFMGMFNIVNYLLGIDETDFLTPPDASFTEVGLGYSDSSVVKEVEQGANPNAFFIYIYGDDYKYDAENHPIMPDKISISYKAEDENSQMLDGALKVCKLDGTEIATLATYDESVLKGLKEYNGTYEFAADASYYEDFFKGTVKFTFYVHNRATVKIKGKETTIDYTDTAELYIKQREMFELD